MYMTVFGVFIPAPSPTHPPIQWVWGIMQSGLEADRSPPSTAKVKNTWSCNSIRLYGVVLN